MRRGGFLWMAACLAAAVLSGIWSLKAGTEADSTEHYLTADLSQPVTAAEAQKTLAGKQKCVTIWGAKEHITLSQTETGRETEAEMLVLCGSSEWVLPGAAILSPSDNRGCLLGKKTAEQLFGGTDIAGEKVEQGGQCWLVRGVIPNISDAFVVEAGERMSKMHLNRITFSHRPQVLTRIRAQAFLDQRGLEGTWLRFDLAHGTRMFQELLPGQWSDFSGWKSNWNTQQSAFSMLRRIHKNNIELTWESLLIKKILWELLAIIFFSIFLSKWITNVFFGMDKERMAY